MSVETYWTVVPVIGIVACLVAGGLLLLTDPKRRRRGQHPAE